MQSEEAKGSNIASKFARFLIQPGRRSSDPRSGAIDNSRSDMVTSAIEIGITPVVTFLIGFGVDHIARTLPIFSIVGLFFGVVGVVLRIYYGLTDNSASGIGRRVGDSTNIDKRLNTRQSPRGHSILSADLTVSDELAESANYLEGGEAKAVDEDE